MDILSVITIIAGLAGILGFLYLIFVGQKTIFDWWQDIKSSNRTKQKSVSFQAHPESLQVLETVGRLGVINVFRPTVTPDNISAKVHRQAKLDFDDNMKVAFYELNRLKESQGKHPFYSNPRYRLIKPPHFQSGKKNFVLDLGEADFAYVALLLDNDVDVATKKYVRKKYKWSQTNFPSTSKVLIPILMV